jgi:regulatory protein
MKAARGGKLQERGAGVTRRADDEDRSSRIATQPGERIMNAALKILSTRSCSEGQLRDRLTKRWVDAGLVEDCIKRLKELGYINDDLFARSYATHRISSKPLGKARLARELAVKKISRNQAEDAIALAFEELPEEGLIDKAISRRLRTHGRPADRAAAKRLFDHLARLGFEYDLIVRKLRALKTEHDETD